jgi:hypothetical protein
MDVNNDKREGTAFSRIRSNSRATVEQARLFEGLERIVNAGDLPADCEMLSRAVPSFWPIVVVDGKSARQITWEPAAWRLFLAYRKYLRRVWVADFIKEGTDNVTLDGPYLNYLLGLDVNFASHEPGQYVDCVLPDRAFTDAWIELTKTYPSAYVTSQSLVVPVWRTGQFVFVSADKSAQTYCSTRCSGGNKLLRGRKYWREKGARLRGAKKQETGRKK